MNDLMNTYEVLGLPDALAVAFVLILLSLTLTPWLGGLEVGPLKIPELDDRSGRAIRILAPVGLVIGLSAFFPAWDSRSGHEGNEKPTPDFVEVLSDGSLLELDDFYSITSIPVHLKLRSMGQDRNGFTADVLFEPADTDRSISIDGLGLQTMRAGDWHDLRSGNIQVRIVVTGISFVDGTDQMEFTFSVLQREA